MTSTEAAEAAEAAEVHEDASTILLDRAPSSPAAAAPAAKPSLIGLTRAELSDVLAKLGVPERRRRMRVAQLMGWLYRRGVEDFEAMTDIGKPLRRLLAESHTLRRPQLVRESLSIDGTRKWLLRLADGALIETVYIPEAERGALCLSSQVGCTLNCRFCHTGRQLRVRNLDAGEIVGQVLFAQARSATTPPHEEAVGTCRVASHIVMMGMGEPLYNFEAVRDALNLIADGEGLAFSRRRITLSTAGVVPMIRRCGEEIDVRLAVSLHAARDELRDELVPLNRKYPLAALLQACRDYPRPAPSRRITFEYTMLDGVNDSPADARALVALIAGLPAKVNLIPFNPWPGAPYRRSSAARIAAFARIVRRAGYASPVRTPRGEDIGAACGQLRTASAPRPKKKA